jgi:vitamin B12 transporter
MCRSFLLFVLLVTTALITQAQYTIQGRVSGSKNEPLEGVSISVKNSYSGATSGKDGCFSFQLPDTGRQVIQFTMMSYRPVEKEINVSTSLAPIDVQLKEAITDMKAVVITAGSFEASDKKRAAVLRSIDVVTTAGQQADIVAALKTLPGAQQVGEQEGLFVRGGSGAETKVFIDGMMVQHPFFSSVPGIVQRSRFSPLLFKGTMFSTGGYSALYGQALSSVLVLESIDLPSRSEVNMIISSPQLSFLSQRLNKSKTSSAGVNINYSNLAPYFGLVKQKFHYSKAPETINGEFNFRHKTKTGIIKLYAYINSSEVGVDRPSLDHPLHKERFNLRNKNIFANATYSGRLKNEWQLYAGTSLSCNDDKIKMQTGNADTVMYNFTPHFTNRTAQSKIVFSKNFPGLSKLYVGAEYQHVKDGIEAKDSIAKRRINDNYVAAFVETDLYYSPKMVSRIGIRHEYSSLLNKTIVSPRFSLAYKLAENGQFSFAYGSFYQKPEANFLLRKNALGFSKATHYILNFQRIFNGQTLRVEVFHKEYKKLLTTDSKNPFTVLNEGYGYARGLEVFWRDKTNVKNLDYWVSYSLLDTKRKYLYYPVAVQPSFAAKHTLNIVAKRFVNALSTQFSTTYSFASGRPYFNPNKPERDFMTDKTISYHSLGLQANYLRTFGNINAVLIANISNVLGSKQVFDYRYASIKNADGEYTRDAVTPMARRFVFVGMYLSIGSDRRKEILD